MPWNDDTWPSVEEILLAHQEDDDGFCPNPDCAFSDIHEGSHVTHVADVIRWVTRPHARVLLAHYTVDKDGVTTQNLPANKHQRTNWTGPRKVA